MTQLNPVSLARQFAQEYAQGIVPAMLKAIHAAKRDTRIIVAGVLAITYPHQVTYLRTVPGVGVLGFLIPAVVDLAMLRLLGIVQTVGMRRPAKVAALVMTGVLGSMSASVNVAAPAAPMARAIFGCLVLVAVGMKVVTSLVGPDFAAMENAEAKATEQGTPTASTGPDPVLSERAKRGAKTRRDKVAAEEQRKQELREARAARRLARQIEQLDAGATVDEVAGADPAPVSPADVVA